LALVCMLFRTGDQHADAALALADFTREVMRA
jgi:hypothetical protein